MRELPFWPPPRWAAGLARVACGGLLGLLVLLTACGSLPKDVLRPTSTAWAHPDATPLGALAAQRRPAQAREGESGLALMASPNLAYASRLALTRGATRTLDIQSYAIHADDSTAALLGEVRAAAQRGVRVRILLDDFHAAGRDAVVLGMARLPNVQMRMFNPLPGPRGLGLLPTLGGLNDFQRMQHRMHNKLYLADNAWGLTGGRNLGDAYFGSAEGSNFIDVDLLAAGPIVRAMSNSFDTYWNHPLAYPVESLLDAATLPPPDPQAIPAADAAASALVLPPPLDLAAQPLVWAPAALLFDQPFKLVPELNDEFTQDTVVDGLVGLMRAARREVLIVSPYFVPGQALMQVFAELRQRGVRVRVLTNSLSSNDAPLAQVGYQRYRERLLRLGVELHEMRALQPRHLDRSVFGWSGGGAKASLHAKIYVVDGRVLSIGSMNLDLRSKLQNTEVALVVRSRSLARQASERVEDTLDDGAWRMQLDDAGRLHWRAPSGASFQDADTEPDTSAALRLFLRLIGPLAPDAML